VIHYEHNHVDGLKAKLQPEAAAFDGNEQGRGPMPIRLAAN
jgi:hypothetical protein